MNALYLLPLLPPLFLIGYYLGRIAIALEEIAEQALRKEDEGK